MNLNNTFQKGAIALLVASAIALAGCSKTDNERQNPIDSVPPTPASISDIEVSDDSANIKWQSGVDNQTAPKDLRYQLLWQGSKNIKTSGSPKAHFSEQTLANLTPNTSYTVWVKVWDKAGNASESPKKIFTTTEDKTIGIRDTNLEPTQKFETDYFIEVTTTKKIGETIHLEIGNAPYKNLKWIDRNHNGVYDKDDVISTIIKGWIDINNSGKFEEGTDEIVGPYRKENFSFPLKSQTFKIYGKVGELKINDNEITSLKLENAPDLKKLDARNNKLTSLDLSLNNKLEELYLRKNTLKNLSLNAFALTTVDLANNMFERLDLSKAPNIEILFLASNPQLSSLTVSEYLLSLESFDTFDTALTSLDLSFCPNLDFLRVSATPLKNLDVSNNSNLTDVSIERFEGKGLIGEALSQFVESLPEKKASKKGDIYLSKDQATEAIKTVLQRKHWNVFEI